MILKIKVKPKSGKQGIEKFNKDKYLIYLKSEPENNKANIELINFLSKHFGVHFSKIKIISGIASDNKLVEIGD